MSTTRAAATPLTAGFGYGIIIGLGAAFGGSFESSNEGERF
jgi:hypothetical protein